MCTVLEFKVPLGRCALQGLSCRLVASAELHGCVQKANVQPTCNGCEQAQEVGATHPLMTGQPPCSAPARSLQCQLHLTQPLQVMRKSGKVLL